MTKKNSREIFVVSVTSVTAAASSDDHVLEVLRARDATERV
jgi:hypothetical protein